METVIILNTIFSLILFVICTIFYINLLKLQNKISVLTKQKERAEEKAKYNEKALKQRSEFEFDDFVKHKYK